MAEHTIEYDGKYQRFDVPVEAGLEAFNKAVDDDGFLTGCGECGDVVVNGDGDDDMYGMIAVMSEHSSDVGWLNCLYDQLQDATGGSRTVFIDSAGYEVALQEGADFEVIADASSAGDCLLLFNRNDLSAEAGTEGHTNEAALEKGSQEWDRAHWFESVEHRDD